MTRIATLVAIPAVAASAASTLVTALLVMAGMTFVPAPAVAAPEVPAAASTAPLRLDLTSMTPRVVTASGPGVLTVTGTLTNTGTVPFDQVVVRIQRSDPLGTEGEVRDALDGNAGTDAVTPQFTPLADELAPGRQVPVSLTVPLRGAPGSSLALTSAGVHELLVNVNGARRGADRARLAAVRMLLPVLSLPALPPPALSAGAAGGTSATTTPTTFSMIYPIADTPHRLSTVPGGRALLTDDSLTASFAPGGRLGGLVAALAQQAPAGSRLRTATCVAVDPDLLETAQAMQTGYDVQGPGGAVAGDGGGVAGQWLAQLTAVTRGGCVIALPYADADLVALTRGGESDLAAAAIRDGRQVVAAVLGTPVLGDVIWPAGGVIDEPTLATIGGAGGRALLLSADGVDEGRSRPSTGVVPVTGSSQFAVLTDPLLAQAAGGPTGSGAPDPGPGGAAVTNTPAGTDTPLSTQDAIGTLAFRARTEQARTGRARTADGPLVLAPPHRWAADGDGARALLQAADQLISAGELTPVSPASVLSAGAAPGTAARPAVYPLASGTQEIGASVVTSIRSTALDVSDLRSAVVPGSGVGISPDEMFAPLLRGLVRPASATLRGDPAAATAAATAGADQIRAVRSTVRVLEPPSPYSLGTSDAPLPLTVANGLPVTVQVRIQIASTSGLRVAPIAPVQIPPLGRRQVSVNAQVTRSGQFTVEATVLTPDGGVLGPASRLKVRSTVYGTITVWLTVGAGVLLVVLVARRMIRRIRGGPGRHSGPEARTDPAPPRPASVPPEPPAAPPTSGPPVAPFPGHGQGPPAGSSFPVPARGAAPNGREPMVPAPEDLSATDRFPARPPSPPEPPHAPSPRP